MALLERLIVISLLATGVLGNGFERLNHIKPKTSPDTQAEAAQELIQRLLPSRASEFKAVVNPDIGPKNLDTYQIFSDGKTVTITGTTGVAVTWGLQHYLKHYCGCHISWNGDQLHLPPPGKLPVVNPALKVTSPNRFRYYQNVCTVSYTFAFWNWTRWERHIDWMALNGINLPLAFNGQEAIWQKVYLKMGFKQEDLDTHFAGPAFLAWARMGNMHGWGGPLPQSWHTQQLALQHQILQRMRSLGMIPVLPAFAGHVPKAMKTLFPNASISYQKWGSFRSEYCCDALLDSQDPLFRPIGKAFIEAMSEEFNGTDHIYNGDTFNEMNPNSSVSDPAKYVANFSRAVYDAILDADKQGIWLMQGWLFQSGYWTQPLIKAYLQAVPIGGMIVLDLAANSGPIYSKTQSFYGQPFIWCLLHNFGGQNGLFGHLDIINTGPFTARAFPNSTMIGMGITPEGILQNTIVYNFYNDMTWRSKDTNVTEWVMDYPTRRYGMQDHNVQSAWLTLRQTVYNSGTTSCRAVVQPPVLTRGCNIWYNLTKELDIWNQLLQAPMAMQSSPLYRYDLVDVTRNALQDIGYYLLKDVIASFQSKDVAALRNNGTWLTGLIMDMDTITSSHADWLLGPWLEAAKSFATNDAEAQLYEYNQRMQITLWGPNGEVLDYAAKQWGSMLGTYYYVRWELFVNYLSECLYQNKTYSQDEFNARAFVWEQSWAYDRSPFPTIPTGASMNISRQLYNKYQSFKPTAVVKEPTPDPEEEFGPSMTSGISHEIMG